VGFSKVTIRDSGDALFGRTKALGGLVLLGGSGFALLDGADDSGLVSSIAEDFAGFAERVRAISYVDKEDSLIDTSSEIV
jgi:hypothetical protein